MKENNLLNDNSALLEKKSTLLKIRYIILICINCHICLIMQIPDESHVVIDRDLATGRSAKEFKHIVTQL